MIIAWFSCGVTSAVACKIALSLYDDVHIYYIETGSGHPDNTRFLADCEKWYGQPIHTIRSDKPNVLHHPELIKYKDGYNFSVCRYTVDCFSGTPIENSPFDSCVSMIKWLIAKGYFSKEYLCNIKQE